MSFLSFRHARRKAKKIVSVRTQRPPTPPTPGSFVSPSVVEIGDPSRPSEADYPSLTCHVDIDIKPEPLFPSDPFLATFRDHSLTTNPSQSRDCPRSRHGATSPKSPHDAVGPVQVVDDGRFPESHVVEDITLTQNSRRAVKVPPAPIKIPTTSHASKVQIQRSACKPTEPRPASLKPGDSPVVDDSESAVSGTTLPGALIANLWTDQADQPHYHLSQRISRMDSAILPVGDNPFTTPKHSGHSNRDGGFVPRIHPLPGVNDTAAGRPTSEQANGVVVSGDEVQTAGKSRSSDRLLDEVTGSERIFSASRPTQISPITELMTPDPSDSGTPDLVKDSSTSVDGGSSDAQPDTSSSSDSAPAAWSSPTSPVSRGEVIMILNVFPTPPSVPRLPTDGSEASWFPSQAGVHTAVERNLDGAAGSRTLFAGQRQIGATPAVPHFPHSRSSLHPSLASVNTHLLHPAKLLPIGERRMYSAHSPSESAAGSQVVALNVADRLSTLPSSLPATRSQHISRLPSFPESAGHSPALRISGFPSLSSSPNFPPSPDLLDHIVLANESSVRRREWTTSHGSMSTMPLSGTKQTFPETPIFSPDVDHSRGSALPFLDSSTRRHAVKSQRGRGCRASQRSQVRRSASTRTPVRMKARGMSSRSELRTSNGTPSMPSSPTVINDGASTATISDQALLGEPTHPQSVAGSDSTYSPRQVLHRYSESRGKAPPPPQPPSLQVIAVKSPSSPASPSLPLLPPPPPPPKLRPPPVSQALALTLPPARPPSFDLHAEVSLSPRSSSLPPVLPSATPPSNPLCIPPTSPVLAPVHPLNSYNTDRPPRPIGPRLPYRHASFSAGSRELYNLNPGSGRLDSFSESSPGPRFQASPPRFKGLTAEAAKWTFTPEELQEIVSHAIRQSGQVSFIRVLSQQAACVDIPEELERLNALMHELKVQYRLQARKRDVLLRSTYAFVENPEFNPIALRSKLHDLHETAIKLDRIAEDLYRARDQAAQLSLMLAVHTGSALAIALRKLHSSLFKWKAEVQALKDHVYALEAERDEAWAQAQRVARDLDDLNDAIQTHDSSPIDMRTTSRCSSRVIASPGIRERLGTLESHLGGLHTPLDLRCRPPFTSGPTSDLSRQNPGRISDLSSSSGRAALTRAEADLCGYLGIDNPGLTARPPRRSSIAVSPSVMSPSARDKAFRRVSDITDHRTTRGCGLSDRSHACVDNGLDVLLNTLILDGQSLIIH